MKCRAAVALIAAGLTLPLLAQHGGGHGGFSGHAGFAGHSGFSGNPGPSGSRGFSQANPRFQYGGFRAQSFRSFAPSGYGAYQSQHSRNGFTAFRPAYRPNFPYLDRNGDHIHDRGHRPRFGGWYGYGYPGLVGYPYPLLLDPGFYDWNDSEDSSYAQNYASPENPGYGDEAPYADYGYQPGVPGANVAPQPELENRPTPPQTQAGSANSPSAQPPLMLFFKNGRAPEKIQNYMLTEKSLIDLDRQQYDEIPLKDVDVAETQQANRAAGIEFQIPTESRN
jgi:hypothetical protein